MNPGGKASTFTIVELPTVAPFLTNESKEVALSDGGVTVAVPSKGTLKSLFSIELPDSD